MSIVDHPAHYQGADGLEAIDVIERYDLGYHLGNALKYLVRAGKKTPDASTDLKKARWYLRRWVTARALGQATEVIAFEGAIKWASPEMIAEKFGLTARVAAAVERVLFVAAFELEETSDEEWIEEVVDLIDRELAGAAEVPA